MSVETYLGMVAIGVATILGILTGVWKLARMYTIRDVMILRHEWEIGELYEELKLKRRGKVDQSAGSIDER